MEKEKSFKQLQNEIDKLTKLISTGKDAQHALRSENINLKNINNILEAEKKQWVEAKELQQQIIQTTLNQANQQSNLYLEQIQDLKRMVTSLKSEIKENKNR